MAAEIVVVSCGMGSEGSLTAEAREAIASAGLLLGAERLISPWAGNKATAAAVSADAVAAKAGEYPGGAPICVLVSGDSGFYSLASSLKERMPQASVRFIPGISSMSCLAARLGESYANWAPASAHGREFDCVAFAAKHPKSFLLTGGVNTPRAILKSLCEAGMAHAAVAVAENLSYESERLSIGTAAELAARDYEALCVMLITNPRAIERQPGIPDEDFIRGEVPMTKFTVRAAAVASLRLGPKDILYDVGAGTGSVAIEAATLASRVYAIEKEPDAIALIRANIEKFAAYNVTPVEGSAPEAFQSLPRPDKAFIGGSSGSLSPIVHSLVAMNPDIRLVATAISLESLSEAIEALGQLGEVDITQLSAAKAKKAGRHHMMMGQNPVYIIKAGGKS